MIVANLFYPLLSLIPALLNAGIVIYILYKLPRGRTTSVFSFFVVALMLWQTQDTIVRLCAHESTARYWDKILCLGWIGVAPLAFHFALRYASVKNFLNRIALISIYLPFLVFYVLYNATERPRTFVKYEGWGWLNIPDPGTTDEIQRYFIAGVVIMALVILFQHAFHVRKNKDERIQAFLIAIGMLVPTVQGILTQVIYPLVLHKNELPITSTFLTFFSVATIIALTRYQLFNIAESVEVQTVLESLKSVVLIISPEQHLIYMNLQAKIIFNIASEDKVHIRKIFPSDDVYQNFEKHILENCIHEIECDSHETTLLSSYGSTIEVLISAEPIRNNNQLQAILLICTDISALKRSEQKQHDLNITLEKRAAELTSSNTELERFAYIASHDLQEPLRIVSRNLQLLEMKYKDQLDETGTNYIQYTINAAARMRQLIVDLLEYSRAGSPEVEDGDSDMNDVMQQVQENLKSDIEETKARIEYNDLPLIPQMSHTQLLQLIQNLVGNALKYHSDDPVIIQVGCKEDDRMWTFSIKDNGIGIEPLYHEKIFIMFQRLHTRTEYSGTGIGLAICKKIVEKHGGRIWVESDGRKGSTFLFTIAKNIQ